MNLAGKISKMLASAGAFVARQVDFIVEGLSDRSAHQPVDYCNIMALLRHLCDFDDEKCQWVLRWLALPLRNPGVKMDMAVVVNGERGTGKRIFFDRVVPELYGGSAACVTAGQLHAVSDRWIAGTSMVVVEGAFSKRNAARFKELVSPRSILVGHPAAQGFRLPNRMNLIFLSHSLEFLPVSESDPRLLVLEAPPAMPRAFYEAATCEIRNGGVEAFRHFLLHDLDMTGFDEHTRPPADAAQRAIRQVA